MTFIAVKKYRQIDNLSSDAYDLLLYNIISSLIKYTIGNNLPNE